MNILKATALAILLSATYSVASAQESEADRYAQRYNRLVSKLGADGVGVETVLNSWEAVDSADLRMLTGKFNYYFVKSRSEQIVTKSERRYLGVSPILQLKDSTGAEVYYYQEYFYNDSLFALSVKAVDRAIKLHPKRLDLKFLKADALAAYEKGSPDMALAWLEGLADEYYTAHPDWEYPSDTVNNEFFTGVMQQYCAQFYNLGTANSYKAFKALSEKMLKYNKNGTMFMDNLGTYMLIAEKNHKAALKWYNKVLKIKPDDYTAIKNSILACRNLKNQKLEVKYLRMMVQYGPESERESARIRLEAFTK